MKTLARVRAVGGSLMVRIPKDLAQEVSLREGELVELHLEKVRQSGFGALKGLRPFSAEDELQAHE